MEKPYLQINTAAGLKQLVLGRDPISIGRHRDNTICLDDDMASRFHCVIEKVKDGYLLRDLGASNGTFVNSNRVKSAKLQPGDTVRVGKTELVLVIPDHEGPEADHEAPEMEPMALDALQEAAAEIEELPELSELDLVDVPVASDLVSFVESDPELALRNLAESLPNKTFGDSQIELLSPRGQTIHPAGGRSSSAGSSRHVVDLFRVLLLACFRGRVTDIHVEPKGEYFQVRLRIDGVLVDAARLPNPLGVRINALVKVLCEIDPSQKNTIQEGHFTARVPGDPAQGGGGMRRVDYRVSFAPAVFGQKLVVRVLDSANAPSRLPDLALAPEMESELERVIQQDSGMVLVCGPTGSGKTSTLYSLVRSLDLHQRNVVTIEDPVEIQIEGVTQLPVDEEKGKSFSGLLRSVLRQDPDVILVGEIRDAETARIAMQAAITGHLVFSTVHTTDTIGTVFRLLDLGVEPYLLAQGLHVVLAQRLVRQLCPLCKVATPITAEQVKAMGPSAEGVTELYEPGGCGSCVGTGYAGRRAFFELLTTTDAVREAIIRNASPQAIQKALQGTWFKTLLQTGYQLVAEGLVCFEEIDRAARR